MKPFILLALFQLCSCLVIGQNKNVNFGIQFIDTITLPSKDNYIVSAELKKLNKHLSKKYYNSNDPLLKFEIDSTKHVTEIGKEDNNHYLLIPPLNPNQFYKLEIKYVGKYNLYGLFRSMNEEGMPDYKDTMKWMDIVKVINMQLEARTDSSNYTIYYHPQVYELEALKAKLSVFENKLDSTKLTKTDTLNLTSLYFDNFKILNFKKDEIKIDTLISFSKWILNETITEESGTRFISSFNFIPDYIGLYQFYEKRLKADMENTDLKNHPVQFMEYIKKEARLELQELKVRYDGYNYIEPNYLQEKVLDTIIMYVEQKQLGTYSNNYETSYKRTLVPDFGYIIYLNGNLKGGSPYVGVHISLVPVNKDVSMQLSQLSLWQRLSIHTGVNLNPVKKENYRDDFFKNYSLLLGGGLKIFTQSTRLNFGGMLFNKIDAISGKNSIAIQPYIGISIDIEIRKWLESSIPSLTSIFKEK